MSMQKLPALSTKKCGDYSPFLTIFIILILFMISFQLNRFTFWEPRTFPKTEVEPEASTQGQALNLEFVAHGSAPEERKVLEYIHPQCGCTKYLSTPAFNPQNLKKESTCNEEATLRGPGQKVISLSLYGQTKERTMHNIGLWPNLNAMRAVYPGWLLRIYSDYNISNPKTEHCEFICKNNDVFWCDVHALPHLGNQEFHEGMTWRFMPLIDPLVDIFLSRDIDSRLGFKEADAVEEWMRSDKVIHIMRDHPYHGVRLLGGMWGVKVHRMRADLRNMTRTIINRSRGVKAKGFDQNLIADLFYVPKYYSEIMAHDSYFCSRYPQTLCVPFPARPPDLAIAQYDVPFVGDVILP